LFDSASALVDSMSDHQCGRPGTLEFTMTSRMRRNLLKTCYLA
jgi:hypothetical protein